MVGDIQGCADAFFALLEQTHFDPARDRLWVAGDLVNRGPGSLAVLRWLHAHDDAVTAVLGNHDLHLLACDRGFRKLKRRDTLAPVLDAPDKSALLDWLRRRPLLVREGGFALFHAGLAPSWSLADACRAARDAEALLRGPRADELLARLRGEAPVWAHSLRHVDRCVATVSVLTRMRACSEDGALIAHVGPPEACPAGARPWYAWRDRSADATLLFGHWAAHGHRVGRGWVSLDSGAVWGGLLTAWRLEDGASVQVPGLVGPDALR